MKNSLLDEKRKEYIQIFAEIERNLFTLKQSKDLAKLTNQKQVKKDLAELEREIKRLKATISKELKKFF